jgi:hypothetical protein
MEFAPSYWISEHLVGGKILHQAKYCNPVDALRKELEQHWEKEQTREVQFPLLLRIGTIF